MALSRHIEKFTVHSCSHDKLIQTINASCLCSVLQPVQTLISTQLLSFVFLFFFLSGRREKGAVCLV